MARCWEMSTLPAGYIPQCKMTSASSCMGHWVSLCVNCCSTIYILANAVRPSDNRRLDDTPFGAETFSWQDQVHSWKAGPGEVMTAENLLSQDETLITVLWIFGKTKQLHKMTTASTQNYNFSPGKFCWKVFILRICLVLQKDNTTLVIASVRLRTQISESSKSINFAEKLGLRLIKNG